MSVFNDILAGGLAAVRSVAGGPVTIRHGASSVTLNAATGRADFPVDETGQVILAATTRVTIFAAADLILGGVQTLPVVGMIVEETTPAGLYRGQIVAQPDGQAFTYSDPNRTTIRVHTTKVL